MPKSRATVTSMPMSDGEHMSVSVRKIFNGYIKSTSKSSGDQYTHEEEFSPTPPTLGKEPPKSTDSGMMAKAIECLNRGKSQT